MTLEEKENILLLKKEFKRIKDMKWIKTIEKGTGGIGTTFEHLLGKTIENFEIPDFNGIEIKTHNNYSKSKIALFSATPDSYLFENVRIKDTYGYPDKDLQSAKVFNGEVVANKRNFIGCKYSFKLYVDRKKEMLLLYVYNYYGKLIDTDLGWTFSILKEKLYRKLRYLAVVDAERRYLNRIIYYKYNNINFYILRDFEEFLTLLENGNITVQFGIGVFKEGRRKGQMHDHGTSFSIQKENIELLFERVI